MSFVYPQYGEGFELLMPSPEAQQFNELLELRGEPLVIISRKQAGSTPYGNPTYTEDRYYVKGFLKSTLGERSTPWNTNSVFFDIFHKPEYAQYSKYRLPYTKALPPDGPLTPSIVKMIQEQLGGDPARWRREMLCEWTKDSDRWLPMNLIAHCQDDKLSYWGLDRPCKGLFYAGVDFGKKRDHSVIVVVERVKWHFYLRHIKQFKLDTPYGVVISYIQRLQDNWDRIASITCD